MSEHTPGPWRVDRGSFGGELSVIAECDDGEVLVAEMEYCFNKEANSPLVAKSPDMYELLEDLALGNSEYGSLSKRAEKLLNEIDGGN